MKKLFAGFVIAGLLAAPGVFAAPKKPKSVLHIINVKFKPDAPKEQVEKAVNMIGEMEHPGLTNVWLKTIKNQLEGPTHILVMEFEDEASFKKYAGSPAQKKWYEVYLKIRDQSLTNDVTN